MTTLITGGRGALGREFTRLMPNALAPTSAELDIRDARAVDACVSGNSVDQVVHCAAATAVRFCEEHKAEAYETNVGGTQNICAALARHASAPRIIYVSTACVFPGDDPDALYDEDDIPHPKNYYALTKLLGEYVVRGWGECANTREALIVRTNFAERGRWKHPKAFIDRFGTYLYPDMIAKRVVSLVDGRVTGTVHVAGSRMLSMYEFARLTDPDVGVISMADYSGPPVTVNMSLASKVIGTLSLADDEQDRVAHCE